jgi:hypothetical protein
MGTFFWASFHAEEPAREELAPLLLEPLINLILLLESDLTVVGMPSDFGIHKSQPLIFTTSKW